MTNLKIERIYQKPVDLNGYRILVDRLWPRGVSKINAHLNEWDKEIGPSTELRQWFNHDVEKYSEFRQRYLVELANNSTMSELISVIKKQLEQQNVILLFGAKDEQHNQAVVLQEYLHNRLS